MNPVLRDKCVGRRIARAGCVEALGIQRVRRSAEDTRVPTAAERVMAWRLRSGRVGLGNAYTFNRKKRDWRPTVPQPVTRTRPELPTTPLPFGRAGSLPFEAIPMNAQLKAIPAIRVHGDTPCTECGDDAELHELKRARELLASGRADELTDAGMEALRRATQPVEPMPPLF